MRKFSDYVGQSTRRFDPGPGFDELAAREAAGAARDAFGWGFRIAALLVLLAVPFARRMVRTPAAARAADAKAREAAVQGGGAPAPLPVAQPAFATPSAGAAVPAPSAPTPVRRGVGGAPNGDVSERIEALESSLAKLRSEVGDAEPANGDGNGERPAPSRRRRVPRFR